MGAVYIQNICQILSASSNKKYKHLCFNNLCAWVTYRLPRIDYVAKLSGISGLRPSCIETDHPIGSNSYLWKSQFTVDSGSHHINFESGYDVNDESLKILNCFN